MRSFDFYEFTGILLPGAVFTLGLMIAFPDLQAVLLSDTVSIGDFGLFVIVAYATGHLIQAAGNVYESLWWKLWGGMPTDWVRRRKRALLDDHQVSALSKAIADSCGLNPALKIEGLNSRQWYAVTRQIYAAVSAAGRSERIDTFNGNYGLNRGLASALLTVLIVGLIIGKIGWDVALVLLAAVTAAVYRMHRFGVHYGRELFVQFLQLAADQIKQKE